MITTLKLDELKFDETKHRYSLNGLYLPSVTSIMRPLSDDVYGDIDKVILNRAAARGTAVHNAIETFSKFGIVDIDPEFEGYFNAFMFWKNQHNVVPYGSEIELYHKSLLYAGMADMAAEVDGVPTLIDFKTSWTVSKMLGGVQLEAYDRAWCSHTGTKQFEQKMIVHLKSDGTYEMIPFAGTETECWRVFTALLTVRNYKEKFKG